MRQGSDFPMPESGDAVPHRCFMTLQLVLLRMLKRLPGMLVSREMFLFSILFAHPMRVGGAVFQFGGALVVLEMRSVIVSGRHSVLPVLTCVKRTKLVARCAFSDDTPLHHAPV
jgi:hypothetical protein